MLGNLLLILGCSGYQFDSVLVVSSDSTDTDLLSNFQDFSNQLRVENLNFEVMNSITLILDITQDTQYLSVLDSLSEFYQAYYLTTASKSGSSFSKFRLYAIPSPFEEGKKMADFIHFLNWTSFTIISFSSLRDLQLTESLKNSVQISKSLYIVQETVKSDSLNSLVKRAIKSSGQKNFVIVGSGKNLNRLQDTLVEKKAVKTGQTFFFPSFAVDQVSIENSLIFSLQGTNSSVSYHQSVSLYLRFLISHFMLNSEAEFLRMCLSNDCSLNFDILLKTNNQKLSVATFAEKIIVSNVDAFVKNSSWLEASSEILLFIANGSSEGTQPNISKSLADYYQGSLYAIDKVNKLGEIQGFYYKTLTTDCGNLIYNEEWYKFCFSKFVSYLPVAYLTSLSFVGAYGNALTLRQFGMTVPQISGFSLTEALDVPEDFPEYLSLSPTFLEYSISALSLVLRNFKWDTFIIYVSDDFIMLNSDILNMMKVTNLKIMNPSHLRFFPSNYSRNDFNQYKPYFQFALDSRCRLFFILSNNPDQILEGLYDIGFRKGDFLAIWNPYIYNKISETADKDLFYKRKELLQGNIILQTKEWEGETGNRLKKELSEVFGNPSSMCITYDSFWVIHSSIKHLITKGEDFEESLMMIKTMRNQRFVGCLGNIYFTPGNNHWGGIKYLFSQFIWNEQTESFQLMEMLVADRFSQETIIVVNQPQWAGSEKIPSNFIDFGNCNFNPRKTQESEPGQIVILVVYSLFFLNVSVFSIAGFYKFRKGFKEFQNNQLISISDMMIISFNFFEFFQYLSLEPKNGIFKKTLDGSHEFIALMLTKYFDLKFERFWNFYDYLIGIAFFFFVLSLVFFIDIRRKIRRNDFLRDILSFFKYLVPIIGNICFLPLNYMLLEIVNCLSSTDDSIYSAYLERDCSQSCYKGKHAVYLNLGLTALLLYSTNSSFFKLLWEMVMKESNLRTHPNFITLLSIFQALLIVTRNVLSLYSEIISGFALSGLLFFFAVYTFFGQTYNLRKISILKVILLVVNSWALLFSTMFAFYGYLIYVYICYLGMLVLGTLGIIYFMILPSGFKNEKGLSVGSLIRFQFSSDFAALYQDSVFKLRKSFEIKTAFSK